MRSCIERIWPWVLGVAGLMNILAFLPQIYQIATTHVTAGVSIPMFWMFLFIQITFGVQGWLTGSRTQTISMLASALESVTVIGLITYLRW